MRNEGLKLQMIGRSAQRSFCRKKALELFVLICAPSEGPFEIIQVCVARAKPETQKHATKLFLFTDTAGALVRLWLVTARLNQDRLATKPSSCRPWCFASVPSLLLRSQRDRMLWLCANLQLHSLRRARNANAGGHSDVMAQGEEQLSCDRQRRTRACVAFGKCAARGLSCILVSGRCVLTCSVSQAAPKLPVNANPFYWAHGWVQAAKPKAQRASWSTAAQMPARQRATKSRGFCGSQGRPRRRPEPCACAAGLLRGRLEEKEGLSLVPRGARCVLLGGFSLRSPGHISKLPIFECCQAGSDELHELKKSCKAPWLPVCAKLEDPSRLAL